MIVYKDNGDLRICRDYSVTVNPNLEIGKYPIPKIDDLFEQIAIQNIIQKLI